MGNSTVSDQCLAVFEADHSPSPSFEDRRDFFGRTSSAAVLARALSLLSNLNSLMRFLPAHQITGLYRVSQHLNFWHDFLILLVAAR